MVHSLSVAAVVVSSMAAATGPIQWQADYGKALAATRTEQQQPLLIVLDNPSDPKSSIESKQLEATGEQSNLLDAYQRCHIDVSTEYGKKVAEVFGAKEFPFTAIIDKTGSFVLCKKSGRLSESQWLETLATYQKGVRPSLSVHTTFYRGNEIQLNASGVADPAFCPSCHLNSK